MSWLKRHEPLILCQSSSIPYVIKEDGVLLCFDNLYCQQAEKIDHSIQFIAYKNDVTQQSTNHFKLKQFPQLIPFAEVKALDDTIAMGRIIKHAQASVEDTKRVLTAHASYSRQLEDHEFQEFVEELDQYDSAFLLVNEDMDPQDRLLEDEMNIIYHRGWYPTAITIADAICTNTNRKYCWTNAVPPISMTVLGLESSDEMNEISECLDNIGIREKEVIWG